MFDLYIFVILNGILYRQVFSFGVLVTTILYHFLVPRSIDATTVWRIPNRGRQFNEWR